jgi:hypothetical protein
VDPDPYQNFMDPQHTGNKYKIFSTVAIAFDLAHCDPASAHVSLKKKEQIFVLRMLPSPNTYDNIEMDKILHGDNYLINYLS